MPATTVLALLSVAAVVAAASPAPASAPAATHLDDASAVTVTAGGTDGYEYTAGTDAWAGVAVRPDHARATLRLYADEAHQQPLATSSQPRRRVDFVVSSADVATAPTMYYPVVTSNGTGTYTAEASYSGPVIIDRTRIPVNMASDDVIEVADAYLDTGVPWQVIVTPSDSSQDVAVFAMRADNTPEASQYLGRADAYGSADRTGAGRREIMTIQGTSDYIGIVIINKAGAGTYTVRTKPVF